MYRNTFPHSFCPVWRQVTCMKFVHWHPSSYESQYCCYEAIKEFLELLNNTLLNYLERLLLFWEDQSALLKCNNRILRNKQVVVSNSSFTMMSYKNPSEEMPYTEAQMSAINIKFTILVLTVCTTSIFWFWVTMFLRIL